MNTAEYKWKTAENKLAVVLKFVMLNISVNS